MIKHVYLYKLLDGVSKQAVAERLMTLRSHIPYMTHMEVGLNFKSAENAYDLMECCEFRTMEDFLKFGMDDYHEKIRQYMKTVAIHGVKIDCEMD